MQKLQQQLNDVKTRGGRRSSSINGVLDDDDYEDAQRNYSRIKIIDFYWLFLVWISGEANKAINDYKYRLQKAEQEIASLQASLARSETQVIRYKSTAEAAEKAETDLKIERRKLQREVSFEVSLRSKRKIFSHFFFFFQLFCPFTAVYERIVGRMSLPIEICLIYFSFFSPGSVEVVVLIWYLISD